MQAINKNNLFWYEFKSIEALLLDKLTNLNIQFCLIFTLPSQIWAFIWGLPDFLVIGFKRLASASISFYLCFCAKNLVLSCPSLQEGQICEVRPPLAMPNGTNTPVSHIILNGSMYKWNPASGILNELSDFILYRQTNGTLWINYSMFFWKISSKKSTFLRFTHQNLLTPRPP